MKKRKSQVVTGRETPEPSAGATLSAWEKMAGSNSSAQSFQLSNTTCHKVEHQDAALWLVVVVHIHRVCEGQTKKLNNGTPGYRLYRNTEQLPIIHPAIKSVLPEPQGINYEAFQNLYHQGMKGL